MSSPSIKAVFTTPQPGPAKVPGSPAPAEPGGSAPAGPILLKRKNRVGGAKSRELYLRLCRTGDLVVALCALVGVFIVANIGRMPGGLGDFLAIRLTVKSVLLLALFCVLWRLIFAACGLYRWEHVRSVWSEGWRIAAACSLAAAVALVFPLTTVSGAFEYETVLGFWGCVLVAVPVSRLVTQLVASRTNLEDIREVVIVGRGPRAIRLWRQLEESPDIGCRVLGFVDAPEGVACPAEVEARTLGTLEDVEAILVSHAVDEVLIALPVKSRYADIERVIRCCESVGVRARYLSDVFQTARPEQRPSGPDETLAIARTVTPDDYRKVIKRAIDVAGAGVGLLLLSPLMLAAAMAVRLNGPGSVIFAQDRYGFNRRRFRMYKFRTMVADAEEQQVRLEELNEAAGPVFKIRADPRVTRPGRLLRKYSIDELPQLVNVLKGEMSLVGPRPLPIRDVHRFTESALMRRFSVRPGLTCLWQISGRNDVSFDRWIELDLEYIDRWSLALDCRILLQTVPVVFRGIGAA
jgi:exopolysaccharide biosynthesis polyprenyl glycosylphosphotransferase